MRYRPYLARVTARTWKAVLIFPVLLLFGAGLIGWALSDLWSFVQALQRGAPRTAWDPADARIVAIGLPLFLTGLLPLAPQPAPHRATRRGAGSAVLAGLAISCALLFVFGPVVARSIARSSTADRGYRECASLGGRHTTLRWVRIERERPLAQCPQRWQDEWM